MESQAKEVDIFGNDDVKYKGKPVKGRRLLRLTVFMIIILSIYVVISHPSEKQIIQNRIKDQENTVPKNKSPQTTGKETDKEEDDNKSLQGDKTGSTTDGKDKEQSTTTSDKEGSTSDSTETTSDSKETTDSTNIDPPAGTDTTTTDDKNVDSTTS